MKKFLTLAITAALLFSSVTVNAATPSVTAKENADYMMSINKDGVPNWFNGVFYSDKYEDLKVAFNKNEKALYNHSLSYGINESRLVTPVLDVVKYRAFYPDLNKAFGDNWKLYIRHYFEYGINEGRESFTDFDAKTYLNMHADLQNAFGTDLVLATRHYIEYGISEGREYDLPETSNGGSSDDDTIDENFTGEKREDREDGSYIITEYRAGKKYARTFYNANNVKVNHEIYNEEGYLYRDLYYDENTGNLTYEYTNTYDTNGNHIKLVEYDVETDRTVTLVYEYDSNGNQIKSEQYDRNEIGEDELAYTITSEYNDIGQKIKDVETNNNEDVVRIVVYTYYDDNVPKSEISYYGETTNKEKEWLFYESGALKSELYYDTEGNITYFWYYDEEGNVIDSSDSGNSEEESPDREVRVEIGDGNYTIHTYVDNILVSKKNYNADDVLTYMCEFDNNGYAVKYSYYENGVLNNFLECEYDSNNRTTKRTEYFVVEGVNQISYCEEFESDGSMIRYWFDENGNVESIEKFDEQGNPIAS